MFNKAGGKRRRLVEATFLAKPTPTVVVLRAHMLPASTMH